MVFAIGVYRPSLCTHFLNMCSCLVYFILSGLFMPVVFFEEYKLRSPTLCYRCSCDVNNFFVIEHTAKIVMHSAYFVYKLIYQINYCTHALNLHSKIFMYKYAHTCMSYNASYKFKNWVDGFKCCINLPCVLVNKHFILKGWLGSFIPFRLMAYI
jgi:hypothetical protein